MTFDPSDFVDCIDEDEDKECSCKRTEVREKTIRGGSKQYVHQCLQCGESVGSPVRQTFLAKPFDDALRDRVRAKKKEEYANERESKTSKWWTVYKEYLLSEDWHNLRIRVLARDKQLCQGCLSATATEVHHLTYKNVTAEFAFELMSLCTPCHERIHQE